MPSKQAVVQQESLPATEKDTQSTSSKTATDGKANSGQIFHLPIPPSGQTISQTKPIPPRFGIKRTENSLIIDYKGTFFFSTTTSYPINIDDIKRALWSAVLLGYFNKVDVKEILEDMGEEYPDDAWLDKSIV